MTPRFAGSLAKAWLVALVGLKIVDLADPIMTGRGGAAAEVPRLVGFVPATCARTGG
jgi:hypothetical protein